MASSKLQARRLFWGIAVCGVASVTTAHAQTRRVDLQILVVSGGAQDSASAMIKAGLDEGLVPYTELDLSAAGRAAITDAFLVDATQPSVRRGRYQAVVLPNDAPTGLLPAEKDALVRYEREFKIRQLDAYVYPSAAVGLGSPLQGGTLDGATASVTPAGTAGPFSYLQGTVPFEDLDPTRAETYAYPATALPPVEGAAYTPFVEATLPGTSARGAILGVYAKDGREEMVFTAAVNQYQSAQKLLFPGILNWLTYGVHVGLSRLSFAVQVDGVLRERGRWSDALHCTLNESCPGGEKGKRILMTPADVDYLSAWQDRQGMKLDLGFHAGAYLDRPADAEANALGRRLLVFRSVLRLINQTYGGESMDCLRDATGRCAVDPAGQITWPTYEAIRTAIAKNSDFAAQAGFKFDLSELATSGHTGLRRGATDADNPNLLRALDSLKVAWIGADGSVDREQRELSAGLRTVPRYPTNLFFNAATKAEEAQEYNWIYSAKAAGGSGSCESNQTCLPPVSLQTGFDTVIVPREVQSALLHVLANDPRPHYVHQANLTEDRIFYPVADGVLAAYRRLFTASAPLENPTLRAAGTELKNRTAYRRGRPRVEAYVQGGAIVLNVQPASGQAGVPVPVTVATTTTRAELTSYWGLRNGWLDLATGRPVQLPLAASVPYGR